MGLSPGYKTTPRDQYAHKEGRRAVEGPQIRPGPDGQGPAPGKGAPHDGGSEYPQRPTYYHPNPGPPELLQPSHLDYGDDYGIYARHGPWNGPPCLRPSPPVGCRPL